MKQTSLLDILPSSNSTSQLKTLKKTCVRCTKCDLHQNRTKVVFGSGALEAEIMLIGEAPGQTEDKTGKPFTGKGGKLLDKMLASINLERAQIYITNIIKCRPANNRTPTEEEIEACRPYLLAQIELINPKIIVLAGASAYRGLTEKQKPISKVRGKWFKWHNSKCISIFHPAYLLRNPSLEKGSPKWVTWQDLISVKRKLNKLTTKLHQ